MGKNQDCEIHMIPKYQDCEIHEVCRKRVQDLWFCRSIDHPFVRLDCRHSLLLYSKCSSAFLYYFCRWYKKDENCFPPSYILQPVTTWIPNYFNDHDQSLKQQAQKQWQNEYNIMREFLQQAAKEGFKDNNIWQKYVRSGEISFEKRACGGH